MTTQQFPPLTMDWQPKLEILQPYAKFLGRMRRIHTPRTKHWFHISLLTNAAGLTTTPLLAGSKTFEMGLDFTVHKLTIATSYGEQWQMPLEGQSIAEFSQAALAALKTMGIKPEMDLEPFSDTTPGTYVRDEIEQYWRALAQIDALFKHFKAGLREESGPVQLWPHHFDLALLWFSGRLIPGADPADEENADEQMNFGFAPGDEGIPEPYFYITAYPLPDGWLETDLPADAEWHTSSFKGAMMTYAALVEAADPGEKLLNFLRTAHDSASALMK